MLAMSRAIEEILKTHLILKLSDFDQLQGAPSQVVSQLMLKGYADNYDYFYQVRRGRCVCNTCVYVFDLHLCMCVVWSR